MLRITIRRAVDSLVLELEGCVCGPWVDELETCWRDVTHGRMDDPRVSVDLRSVCHIDATGRVLMQRMYDEGVQFVASGIVFPELVRELEQHKPASSISART